MQVKNLFANVSQNLKALIGRLEVQRNAMHNPSDKADLSEWIDDCRAQAMALEAIAAVYGPVIQSALNAGVAGYSHRVTVAQQHVYNPETGEKIWQEISSHEYEVPKFEGRSSHG